MFRPRVIPVLLLKGSGLVKSKQFGHYQYIGDPINAVRLFNDLRADEFVFLDINATPEQRTISLDFIKDIGEEANMPFAVGGGIRTLEDIQKIINAGAEKVIINSYASQNPLFIKQASNEFGSSTISVCMDVKKKLFGGERTWIQGGTKSTKYNPVEFAKLMEDQGAGEIIVQSIAHDGMMDGYHLDLIKEISNEVTIPVVALGGAGSLQDLKDGYHLGLASGLAAGSMFVFQSKNRGVLINYPERKDLQF